jgi:hypothetical protein
VRRELICHALRESFGNLLSQPDKPANRSQNWVVYAIEGVIVAELVRGARGSTDLIKYRIESAVGFC